MPHDPSRPVHRTSWRRLTQLTVVCAAYLVQAGCLNFSDERANPLPSQALNYLIDGPRVLALRSDPPVLMAGEAVTLQGLVMGPEPIETVSTSICGWRDDVAVSVFTSACFRNPDAVTALGQGLPLTWTVPAPEASVRASACSLEDTGFSSVYDCFSTVPLLVEATAGDAVGLGGAQARIFLGSREQLSLAPEEVPTLTDLDVRLTASETVVSPGDQVVLELTWPETDLPPVPDVIRWYVDAGTLLKTGLTRVQREDELGQHSDNVLVIPEDASGPLRVAAVLTGGPWSGDDDMAWRERILFSELRGPYLDRAWATLTLEVRP